MRHKTQQKERALTDASNDLIARCDEILSACDEKDVRPLQDLFSDKGIRLTSEICLAFMRTVASTSDAQLKSHTKTLQNLRECVRRTNEALALRAKTNGATMRGIEACEELLFDLLLARHDALRVLNALALQNEHVLRAVLTVGFSTLCARLCDDDNAEKRLLTRIKHPLGTYLIDQLKKALEIHPDSSCHHPKAERNRLVQEVILYLARSGVIFSIHNACAHVVGKDHMTTHPWLYDWCHQHKDEIRDQVDRIKR